MAEREVGGQIRTVGRLTFDDRRVTHVFSPVGGRITRLLADPGQTVRAGQPLALLESPDLGSALSDLRKAEAAFAAADREHLRQKELFEAHAGAQRDLEAAQAAYLTAKAEKERAAQRASFFHVREGQEGSQVNQGFQLRSPIAGEVIARGANPGVEVQGQYGGGAAVELFTIGDLGTLWLLADLYEMDLFRVKPGSAVQITVKGNPGPALSSRIEWISSTLDPATRTAKLRCVVPNPRHLLKPEMYAEAVISAAPARALAIPRSAVLRVGSGTYACVELPPRPDGGRRFELRPVEVEEQEAGSWVAVKSGLAAGERVASHGALLLAGRS